MDNKRAAWDKRELFYKSWISFSINPLHAEYKRRVTMTTASTLYT
jgi:hypothetical protein